MKTEFKRDLNHNYMIITGTDVDTASYQIRMLVGNTVPSLLKCRVQAMDGEFRFYYDITSRQSVSSLFDRGKFKAEDLRMLLGGFLQVMDEMGEYLMNASQLVLNPEYIYLDMEKRMVYFCCLPGYDRDVREQFQQLTEYILPRLDHQDARAVIVGYGVYRRALEDNFHLEHIKEEVYREEEELPGERNLFSAPEGLPEKPVCREEEQPVQKQEEGFPGEIPLYREETPEKGKKGEKNYLELQLAVCAVCAVALGGVLAAKAMGYLPWIGMEVVLGAAVALLGTGLLAEYLGKKQHQVREEGKKRAEKRRKLIQDDREIQDKPKEYEKSFESLEEGRYSHKDRSEGKQKSAEPERQESAAEIAENENYGETVVLSEGSVRGPAALVSRESGELATIYLREDITVIGKLATAADAVIDLPTVSRIHAKIRKAENEYYLTDLNSRNGTAVNGRLLKNAEDYCLQDEDEVDFAQARYVFLR